METLNQQQVWLEEDRGLLISEASDGSYRVFIIIGNEKCWTQDDESFHCFDNKDLLGEFLLALFGEVY